MTTKAKRRVIKKQATIGEALKGVDASDRRVFREENSLMSELVNPPLSQSTTERIERLEASSARTGQRLGNIRMN